MSFLPQHNYLTTTRSPVPLPKSYVICLGTSTTTKTRPRSDQLILEARPLNRPTKLVTSISTPSMTEVLSLQSTLPQRLWLATGCTTVLISLAKAMLAATSSHTWIEPIVASYIGYALADLGSGVYHWGIDNYGDVSTPIFGNQIEAFQGHHKWPWTITRRQFANNLHALARAIAFVVLPIDLTCNDPTLLGFVSVCSGCIMFSQQFHAWAHSTKSKLPPLVVTLQDMGVLVSRSQHAAHHRPPYNNNYCIVSGVWNEFLDRNKVFETLEMVLFFKTGVRPRSWSEPSSDWNEELDSSSQVSIGH